MRCAIEMDKAQDRIASAVGRGICAIKKGMLKATIKREPPTSNDKIGSRVVTGPACCGAQKADHEKQEKLLLRVPVEEKAVVGNLSKSLGMHKNAGMRSWRLPREKGTLC